MPTERSGTPKTTVELQADTRYTIEGPFTVAELEAKHMIQIRETGEVVTFGNSRERWNTFKGTMLDGDQIFSLAFRVGGYQVDGLALIHTGCVVKFLLANAEKSDQLSHQLRDDLIAIGRTSQSPRRRAAAHVNCQAA